MSIRRERYKTGSVVFDRRRKTWRFLWWDDGKRCSHPIGSLQEFPTKSAAQRAAEAYRHTSALVPTTRKAEIPTVGELVQAYRQEKMPMRHSTRVGYEAWIKNHILPRWGDSAITYLQARPVELWLGSLNIAPKSRVHIRGLISGLWDYAMWRGDVPTVRNPMQLVSIKGATKRMRKPRSLTAEEFHAFIGHLDEPFGTMALVCVCFGLRISECLGLKWSDIDWLNGKLRIERGIVRQHVAAVKTDYSARQMNIDCKLLDMLKVCKQSSGFGTESDWVFASPSQLGRLPWSYPHVWRKFQDAASAAGIEKVSTHTMRHTYRSWLDAVGTAVAVQQKLMRHSDIRTTMNIYGDVVTDEMAEAGSKIAELALSRRVPANGSQADRGVM